MTRTEPIPPEPSPAAAAVGRAIEEGRMGDRLWLYSNYHCNLRCSYCLTESGPGVERRLMSPDQMLDAADQARALGFRAIGLTGGEPFLVPEMPEVMAELARRLPLLVLSNATLFRPKLLERLRPLAGQPVAIQVSLDSAEPDLNDAFRGPRNFARVVEAIPRLIEIGVKVRVATTSEHNNAEDMDALCALHRRLGVAEEDHLVREVVTRGRAVTNGMGVVACPADYPPELTLSAEGAFWTPFGPTVLAGRPDTDLMISRQQFPLEVPAAEMLKLVETASEGRETARNLRCA